MRRATGSEKRGMALSPPVELCSYASVGALTIAAGCETETRLEWVRDVLVDRRLQQQCERFQLEISVSTAYPGLYVPILVTVPRVDGEKREMMTLAADNEREFPAGDCSLTVYRY